MAAAMLIPAAIGAASGLFSHFTQKKQKEKVRQLPAMTGGQMSLLDQLTGGMRGPMGQGMDYLSQMLSGSPESYQNFEAPYMRQFQEDIIPGLENAATSFGMRGSSGMQQTLAQAGTGLQERLAMMREGLKSQAMSQLQGMMGTAMGVKPYNTIHTPEGRDPTALSSMFGGIAGGAASSFGKGLDQWTSQLGQPQIFPYKRPLQSGEMYSPSYGYGYAG
jgi:hypothetical protein